MEKKVLQWHPAFYAGLQIELVHRPLNKYYVKRPRLPLR